MRNIKIKVTYGRTYPLGDYNNVCPEVTIDCEVERLEDYGAVIQRLIKEAQDYVNDAVDVALEAEGKPPAFYNGTRYSWLIQQNEYVVCIYRVDLRDKLPQEYGSHYLDGDKRGYRLEWLETYKFTPATFRKYHKYTFYYVHNEDDVARLPDIRDLKLFRDAQEQQSVIMCSGCPQLRYRFELVRFYDKRSPQALLAEVCQEYPDDRVVLWDDVPDEWLNPNPDETPF